MLKIVHLADTAPEPKAKKLTARQQEQQRIERDSALSLANWRIREEPKAIAMFAKENAEQDELERLFYLENQQYLNEKDVL